MIPSPSPAPPQPGSSSAGSEGLFILSCHRSGSTLLRFILDTHPDIYCPPEIFLGTTAFYLQDFMAGLQGGPPGTPAAAEWIRGILGGQMTAQAARRNKRIWCEKTPENLGHLPLIDTVFPSARHLCLYRHGLDVVQSAIKMLDGIPSLEPYLLRSHGNPVLAGIRYWNERTRDLLQFEQANPGRCFHLRYEELVTAPQRVLEPLFAFLEVPWDPRLLDAVFSSDHDPGMEDHYARFATRIYSTSRGAGRNLPLDGVPGEDLREMRELLAQLGYPPVPEEPAASGKAGSQSPETPGGADVRWLFDTHLPEQLRNRPPARATGTYKIKVAGEGGGTWVIDLAGGSPRVRPGDADALCLVELSANSMRDLAAGRLNPLKAFEQGKVRVRGRFDAGTLKEVLELLRI